MNALFTASMSQLVLGKEQRGGNLADARQVPAVQQGFGGLNGDLGIVGVEE